MKMKYSVPRRYKGGSKPSRRGSMWEDIMGGSYKSYNSARASNRQIDYFGL